MLRPSVAGSEHYVCRFPYIGSASLKDLRMVCYFSDRSLYNDDFIRINRRVPPISEWFCMRTKPKRSTLHSNLAQGAHIWWQKDRLLSPRLHRRAYQHLIDQNHGWLWHWRRFGHLRCFRPGYSRLLRCLEGKGGCGWGTSRCAANSQDSTLSNNL
jgi:hypothetical protein